jgi:2-polyprenyl-6-methoxyphenol hydroxylase-like FAD-dependent oxidoreductase
MRIDVIGGGIGGLTTALALRQFGFEPDVFEQAPDLLDVGAAILMWPNAMRVLDRLGLAETIRQHGGMLEQACWLNRDGKLLNHFRLPKTDIPAIALHRAELQRTLLQALPRESIHLGHAFEASEQLPDRIVAHFSNGSSFESDVLIAADGLHSRARAQLLNDGPPADRGYTAWRGVVPYTPASLTPATAIEIYGHGQRFGIGPLGSGKVGWWASTNKTSGPLPMRKENGEISRSDAATSATRDSSRPTSITSEGGTTTREELLRLFDGWCEPVLELIGETPLTSLIRNAVSDRRPVRGWGMGAMTLLGDAIHPTTPNLGQGGCLAIEDAAVLARCLNKYGSSERSSDAATRSAISVALRRFESVRFARTSAISRYSRAYGVIGQWENPWAVQLRGLILSFVPKRLVERFLRGIFNYDAYAVSI